MKGKFVPRDGYSYRMPVHFNGWPYDGGNRVVYSDVYMMSVCQRTDPAALAAFIPAEFELLDGNIQWSYCNCRGVDFMSGGEYRIFQVNAHVSLASKDGSIEGWYPLVIWENDAHPVIGGREEDGMPKLICDISPERHVDAHWFASASLNCETMARFDFVDEREATGEEVSAMAQKINAFGYRYLPHPDRSGAAYRGIVLYPQSCTPSRAWLGTGKVSLFMPDPWYRIPNMALILGGLTGLPNNGFYGGVRQRCTLKLCVADSQELL